VSSRGGVRSFEERGNRLGKEETGPSFVVTTKRVYAKPPGAGPDQSQLP